MAAVNNYRITQAFRSVDHLSDPERARLAATLVNDLLARTNASAIQTFVDCLDDDLVDQSLLLVAIAAPDDVCEDCGCQQCRCEEE